MLRECASCGTIKTASDMATFIDTEERWYCHPVLESGDDDADTCFIIAQRSRMEEHLKKREGDQALPTVNDQPFVQDQLLAYIEHRKQVGISRYGTALQPNNGRDALRDLFEELIDAAVYTAQLLIERDGELPA